MTPACIFSADLRVAADHGQIYVYSSAASWLDFDNVFLDALDDALDSGCYIGAAGGLIDVLTPGQWNFDTPMHIEVWADEPGSDMPDWQHEVDIDLDIPDGTLQFEASGGGPATSVALPAGQYRARISGRGYPKLGDAGAECEDSYRIRLWPRQARSYPLLRKCWPGWNERFQFD